MKILKTILALISPFFLLASCSHDDGDGGIVPEIQLLSRLDFPETMAEIWGYVDNTGKEYALIGFGLFTDPPQAGVYIVDVSDPRNPVQAAKVTDAAGFDVKVWRNFMYSVNGRGSGLGGIVDISDPRHPQLVGSFPSSHTIFIADNGYLYSEFPGLRIFNLNPDPTNPALVWSDSTTGGHAAAVVGNRLYDFHGSAATHIYDVSNPSQPRLLGSIDPPFIRYHHSGWPSENGRFLFICDEGASHPDDDITVWDISDVANPEFVGGYKDSTAIVHNLIIVGNYAYVAYYNSGFRVFDVSDPRKFKLVDEFDTNADSGEFFNGAYGAYPFTPSDNIYVSDMGNGLHVFSFNKESGKSVNYITAP